MANDVLVEVYRHLVAIMESDAMMGSEDIEHLCDAANLILAARPDLERKENGDGNN